MSRRTALRTGIASAAQAACIDILERRQLLSASLVDGTLTVDGTAGNDSIFVMFALPAQLDVRINSVSAGLFDSAQVTSVVVNGLAGNDAIQTGLAAHVYGGDGNDTITSSFGDDTLDGGNGDDTYVFANGWGQDLIIELADGGNDTLDFSAVTTNLVVNLTVLSIASAGNTVNHGEGQIENIIGGAGNDVFYFTDDVAIAGQISGGGGTNALVYSACTNPVTVNLGAGDASQVGSIADIDNVVGSQAADHITGDSGNNMLDGGGGNDVLNGGGGSDNFVLTGGGDDQVTGSPSGSLNFSAYKGKLKFVIGVSSVQVIGGGQTLAHAGNNLAAIRGGSSNDTFVFMPGGSFSGVIDGGAGRNTLDYRRAKTGVTVRLDRGRASFAGRVRNIGDVIGSAYRDVIYGNNLANRLYGMAGNDVIVDNDSQRDYIDGGLGVDRAIHGLGDRLFATEVVIRG